MEEIKIQVFGEEEGGTQGNQVNISLLDRDEFNRKGGDIEIISRRCSNK